MFPQKIRKTFRVSTSRVYLSGHHSVLARFMHFMKPYTGRAVYRQASGALIAL